MEAPKRIGDSSLGSATRTLIMRRNVYVSIHKRPEHISRKLARSLPSERYKLGKKGQLRQEVTLSPQNEITPRKCLGQDRKETRKTDRGMGNLQAPNHFRRYLSRVERYRCMSTHLFTINDGGRSHYSYSDPRTRVADLESLATS